MREQEASAAQASATAMKRSGDDAVLFMVDNYDIAAAPGCEPAFPERKVRFPPVCSRFAATNQSRTGWFGSSFEPARPLGKCLASSAPTARTPATEPWRNRPAR